MFIRTESYRKYFKSYLLSTITIIIISAVMIYMVFSSNNPYEVGGIQRGVLETGEYWRFVTYAFLHHNVYHYLFNAGAILIFGPPLEEKLGKTRFLMLIIGTVILTPIPIIFTTPIAGVGISGFVFGMLGFYLFNRRYLLEDEFDRKLIIQFTIFSWVFTFIFSAFTQQIVTIMGHLGGFMTGLFLGMISHLENSKSKKGAPY
ncbi:Rhomboid protease GluP [Bacillus sp. THAF10]|uniref:rhomboid family intramembrane serine protease n=1 Tax=Bacillus sp. THAF10 TaxID=2587848 RepID=UPI001269230D|nr:rhomboid family intramembrane serine protease [Bacillus sp. THAF10]QFT87995.1 Rhomboid protease GluP [Bacillus sp. THAF10]